MKGEANQGAKREEIDLIALAKVIWERRNVVMYTVVFFIVLGLLIAFLSPVQFTASTTFVPHTADGNRATTSLGGLASLAGINLGNLGGGSEIPPALYPKIVNSVTFKKALLDAEFKIEGVEELVTYRKYYETIYSPGVFEVIKQSIFGLPGVFRSVVKGNQEQRESSEIDTRLVRISEEENKHFKRLEKQLSIVPNGKEGFVVVSFSFPEPTMAAQLTYLAQDLLHRELIAYKISNAEEQLKFTERRYTEKKLEFEEIRSKLATYRDRNQNIASAAVNNQLLQLEAEYNFAFNIYTELAKQLEQARFQVAKDTPVFSIIQPVTIPNEKSAPRRVVILLVFCVMGVILGFGLIFGLEFLKSVKEQWTG
ncbi:hypothetical protein ADIS_2034 [Lunatimonas lonarensis]|uniref:Polysaccharide chain length determinant N-terminal domain-containing protein n=1 Tax=Lunatimonas lonarensis TaxID=1232681 RepID=R7ZU31_9BACT|nr:Wzz/FepE/Etk N-terminal domain-containing protein [Lunatimonas lonarensis]EON77504.1 hypothetical protein ADIS_2034 [Lunatimonas lonarensis]